MQLLHQYFTLQLVQVSQFALQDVPIYGTGSHVMVRPLFGDVMFFISCPLLFLLPTLFTDVLILGYYFAKFDFKFFHQHPHLILLPRFHHYR